MVVLFQRCFILYNDVNPISEIRTNTELNHILDNHIRRKMTPYEPLDSL